MEDTKESNQVTVVNNTDEEIIKPHQEKTEQQIEDVELQQQDVKPNLTEESEEEAKEIESPGEKQEQQHQEKQQEPQTIVYEEDDDEYDDDDEEKDTSQKLVIDIPDEEEEEEKEDEDDDIIALDDIPEEVPAEKEKNSPKLLKVDAIITLSDGEDDSVNEAVSKPGKIQKRRSVGASPSHEEEPIRLKRRKINAAGAPKLPLTGYVRYMHDRRDSIRKEHPSKTHVECNKMIGEEWHSLPADVKSSYLKAADVDKQRYVKELQSFLKTRPDVLANELAKNKTRKTAENNSPNASTTTTSAAAKSVFKDKSQANDNSKTTKDNIKDKVAKEIVSTPSTSQQIAEKSYNDKNKRKRTPTPPTCTTTTNATPSTTVSASTSSSIVTPTTGEIPIFTNEFLEHNKIYDMELRSLRKSKTDLELQNSVLEKHVENMKFGVEKMVTENNELEEKNRLLEIYLDKLKRKLALALSSLPLPSAPSGATVDNIDTYMQDLYKMSTSNSTDLATLNKAMDIIRKLDLQIQL